MVMTTHSSTCPESVTLWGVNISPYVRKVQIALEEKKIPYQHMQILPKALLQATGQAVPADFQQASPLGKIPALQIGAFCIADSAVISAYLDKKYPQGQKLYPNDPESYARALWFENYGDTILSSVAYQKIFLEAVVKPAVFGAVPNEEIIANAKSQELPAQLDYLETEVGKFAWIAGDDFSMADVAIVTHLISLEQAGFSLAETRWKKLAQYKEKVTARDSFKKI